MTNAKLTERRGVTNGAPSQRPCPPAECAAIEKLDLLIFTLCKSADEFALGIDSWDRDELYNAQHEIGPKERCMMEPLFMRMYFSYSRLRIFFIYFLASRFSRDSLSG